MQNKENKNPNIIVGIVIILIGALFLFKNFGLFPDFSLGIFFKWQSILIIIGIIAYLNSGNKLVGIFITLLGIIGFIPNFWAIILIGVGVYIIYKTKENSAVNTVSGEPTLNNPNDFINDISIFGGSKKKYQIDGFRGGSIISIFGGSEIDFLDSTLSTNKNILNLFFIFGGSNLRVPINWNITYQITPIFGALKDKRQIISDEDSENEKIILKGFILFGGCDLYST